MQPPFTARVARRLLGALPLTLFLLCTACEGAAPNTIGQYCRRDTDCTPALRCLNLVCSEVHGVDLGITPVDSGPADLGSTDSGPVDSGPVDSGPVDSGPVDSGPVDSGPVDSGP